MAKKIRIAGKALERIKITGLVLPHVEPTEFGAALGAESFRERQSKNPDLISLGELGNELIKRLRTD